MDLDNDWRLQRELNASGAGDPYVRFPLPGLSARARTAEALNAAGQANRNFLRASTRADTYTLYVASVLCAGCAGNSGTYRHMYTRGARTGRSTPRSSLSHAAVLTAYRVCVCGTVQASTRR